MTHNIKLEKGEYGNRAVITSTWSVDMISFLLNENIMELELNDGKGWQGDDILFLANFPNLQALKLIDLKIKDIDPIHYLTNLKRLELITYSKTEINFSVFSQLVVCALEWRPKVSSFFEATTLRRLFINRYPGKNVDLFAKLVNLQSLAILNAPIENLYGISQLVGLRSLRLANLKQLRSLAGIENLINLEQLEIHTCPAVSSIEEIGSLLRLKK